MHFLLAQAEWPTPIDKLALLLFVVGGFALPAAGYLFMVIDIRAYLRRIKGALVLVAHYFPEMPDWVRAHTPPCLRVLGLRMPCTEADVRQAYRTQAEQLHPDRGGDRRRFMQLQQQFESALSFVREQ